MKKQRFRPSWFGGKREKTKGADPKDRQRRRQPRKKTGEKRAVMNCRVGDRTFVYRSEGGTALLCRETLPAFFPGEDGNIAVTEEGAERLRAYYRALSEELRAGVLASFREKKPAGFIRVTVTSHTEVRKEVLCVDRQVRICVGRETVSEAAFSDRFSLPDCFLIG